MPPVRVYRGEHTGNLQLSLGNRRGSDNPRERFLMKLQLRETALSGLIFCCLVSALLGAAGCGGRSTTGEGLAVEPANLQLWPGDEGLTARRSGCDILPGQAVPGGEFTIALFDSVDPGRAPVPHNQAERLVFAQLYETLVNVDCDGTVRPGLAERWTCTEDSTVWVFTLREDARMWDGTRVTPGEVREAWTLNQDCPRTRSVASPWSWFNARARTVALLDARRLAVRLPEPQADFPLLLAHPATAVALPREGWTWPVGSGPCRLRATTPAPLPSLECRPNPHHPHHPIWKSLTFNVTPGRDPRDLSANPADLLVVRNLAGLRFFQEAPGYQAVPLPWDRLYLLVACPEQNPEGGLSWKRAADHLDPVKDLTTISARSWPEIVFPSGNRVDCPQLAGPVAMGGSARRGWNLDRLKLAGDALVYLQDDPGAAEIANRLGAVSDRPIRVVGLPGDAFTFVLDWQMAGAHILRLDQVFPTRCLQSAALLGQAAWIQKAGLGNDPGNARDFIHPVALSRPWLITRDRLAGLRLAYDGTPLLDGLGRDTSDNTAGETLP
jgi:hypothetical protein